MQQASDCRRAPPATTLLSSDLAWIQRIPQTLEPMLAVEALFPTSAMMVLWEGFRFLFLASAPKVPRRHTNTSSTALGADGELHHHRLKKGAHGSGTGRRRTASFRSGTMSPSFPNSSDGEILGCGAGNSSTIGAERVKVNERLHARRQPARVRACATPVLASVVDPLEGSGLRAAVEGIQ